MKTLIAGGVLFFLSSMAVMVCAQVKSKTVRQAKGWQAGMVVSEKDVKAQGLDEWFQSETISDSLFARMWGKSWKHDCTLQRSDLCYLHLLHRNADGQSQTGEMVCNQRIATKLLSIFRQLYEAGYRIERIVLIDEYDADDDCSMRANNTSCFNYRGVNGASRQLSKHALGLAVDINPLYNPCVRRGKNGSNIVQPATGRPYAFNRERRTDIPYKITATDLACRLFREAGFTWGGSWRSLKDYQHFEWRE